MRICYLNHDLRSNTGAGRFCSSLIKVLKIRIPNLEYRVLTHDDILPINIFRLLFALPYIRKILKEYDIVHALDGWPYGVIAAISLIGLKKKLMITAIATGAVKPLYHPIKFWILRWAYKRADILTAASRNTKREILKRIPGLKIEVINHGVDFEKFSPFERSPEGGQIKSQIPISNLKPYILSVGTDKPRKGFEYSIRAFAEIRKEFPELKYVIVGDIRRKEILNLINNLGLEGGIKILKDLKEADLISLYKNAELFILLPVDDNKDIEAFGLVFLEAAACGLPVIGTNNSGAEDAVSDGSNGILVAPRNSAEAAEAVKRILSDKMLKEKFSKKSVEFAASMNWDKQAKLYLEIYKSP